MAVLIDTNIFFRAVFEPEKLGQTALQCLNDVSQMCFISPIVGVEMAIKSGLGKLNLGSRFEPFGEAYEAQVEALALQVLPILPAHMQVLKDLPLLHRDPFDRLMLSQCKAEGYAFLTADKTLSAYRGIEVRVDEI